MKKPLQEPSAIDPYSNTDNNSPYKNQKGRNNMNLHEKYRNQSTVNQTVAIPFLDASQKQEKDNSLSSIIMKSSLAKPEVKDKLAAISSNTDETIQVDSNQDIAMNLSANIFLNTTTKFLKGFEKGSPLNISSQGKQKKTLPLIERTEREISLTKKQVSRISPDQHQRVPEMKGGLNRFTVLDTDNAVIQSDKQITYPSKAKIQRIIRGGKDQQISSLSQNGHEKLQQTLSRNRLLTEKSASNARNESKSSHNESRSGSLGRLSRRKQKVRELKFLQKKQKSENSITLKQEARTQRDAEFKTKRNDTKIKERLPSALRQAITPLQVVNNMSYKANEEGQEEPSTPLQVNKIKPKGSISNNNRTSINEVKSADVKHVEQKQEPNRPFARQATNVKLQSIPIQKNKISQKSNVMTPSIISDLSSVIGSPNQGYRINAFLPSGELPIETPVKAPRLKNQLSRLMDQRDDHLYAKTATKSKPALPSQISAIKQENSSDIYTNRNSRRAGYHGSTKEQVSTHIDYNPTQIACAAGNQMSNFSKFGKNQSTKAIGRQDPEQQWGLSTLIRMQDNQNDQKESKVNVVSIFQPKKPFSKPNKEVKIEIIPINNSISLLESQVPQRSTVNRKNMKSLPPQEISSMTSIEQFSSINKNTNVRSTHRLNTTKEIPSTDNTLRSTHDIPQEIVEIGQNKKNSRISQIVPNNQKVALLKKLEESSKIEETVSEKQANPKRISVIANSINKLYLNTLRRTFISIKSKANSLLKHNKQAEILLYSASNLYKHLYTFNTRATLEQLKKLSLANPINKKPIATLSHCRAAAANLIFRILESKQRESYHELKLKTKMMKSPPQLSAPKQSHSQELQGSKSKAYILSQLIKITQNYNLNRKQGSFNKILTQSSRNQPKFLRKQQLPIQNARSPPKYTKPQRDYLSQRNILINSKEILESQLSRLQLKQSEQKRSTNIEKARLIRRQDELRKKNQTTERQVNQKRKLNNDLKSQLDQHTQSQQDIFLPEFESLIGLLTEIYSTIFRNNDETFNPNDLISKYSLVKQSENPTLEQWQSMIENIHLKSELSKWQGEVKLNRSKEILLAEQALITKVLKSYVRERYLWEWVKMTAQKL